MRVRDASLASGAQPAPQRLPWDAVDEHALTVDRDNRQPLAMLRLERGIAGDVHLVVRDALVVEHRARLLAQMAAVRGVQDDFTDRCRA